MSSKSFKLTTLATLFLAATSALAQVAPQRPPSVPLVAHDPYFSIWSPYNLPTDGSTTHWTDKQGNPNDRRFQRLTSTVTIDGKAYRLLGEGEAPVLQQTNQAVTPTRTIYTYQGAGVEVTLTFTSPLLPDDLLVTSRPVTYVTWTVKATDGKSHDLQIAFTAGAELAVNTPDQEVKYDNQGSAGLSYVSVGSTEQRVLGKRGDDLRIDWGRLYLAVPTGSGVSSVTAGNGAVPASKGEPLTGKVSLSGVSASPVSTHMLLAYDDEFSIKYYRTQLKPYWRKDGADAAKLLETAEKEYESLMARCEAFDKELTADMRKIGGESYVQLGVLAWRQTLAAQKICADDNGQPLAFSKENFSNGCIATVDILYPTAPHMLAFCPSLLKASLVPLMDYSASERWKHDSAPHDLGTYPFATGQVYGGETSSPMPVEESGNMLIIFGALSKSEGNAELAKKYWPVLTTWNNYLVQHGLDPENQLCTDDFAGHIARNANLSVKAILGIASYGLMADMLGHKAEAAKATATARDYAKKWMAMADQGDHYGLVFGEKGKDTWSQKYNLVWDKLLGLNIFPAEVAQKEMAFYRTKMNKYGVPLDSRRAYTKLDWELWTATMAEKHEDFQAIVDACAKWANETPTRVPLCDWYETDNGRQSGFQARSVVGGLFIPFLADKTLWTKYASRDKLNPNNWAPAPTQRPPQKVIIPAADTAPATWSYTTDKPADNWFAVDFKPSKWKTGQSGFGTRDTPGAVVHTVWNTPDIYIRRTFTLNDTNFNDPQLYLHHDEDVDVYLNGQLIYRSAGFTAAYDTFPLSKEAKALLRKGTNTLALHCHQTIGGQYLDVGLIDLLPVPAKK